MVVLIDILVLAWWDPGAKRERRGILPVQTPWTTMVDL
jgi:hypothetical protein